MFRLHRWYVDLITPEGAAFVGCMVRLRLDGLSVGYGWTAIALPPADLFGTSRVRSSCEPRVCADRSIHWASPALGIVADWRPRVPVVSRQLFGGARGGVVWQCVAPAAEASVRIGPIELHGTGYVERLMLDLESWEMPVAELRCGRFLAPGTSLSWIDWRGSRPFRLVMRDGVAQPNASFGNGLIRGAGWRLDLDGCRAARRKRLPNVLSSVPHTTRVPSHRLTGAREIRWVTRGALTGQHPVLGCVIQETARWSARVAA